MFLGSFRLPRFRKGGGLEGYFLKLDRYYYDWKTPLDVLSQSRNAAGISAPPLPALK